MQAPEGKKESILLVYSDRELLEAASETVAGQGYWPILTAESPGEALKIVTARAPHLLVTDFRFPGADVLTLLRSLRALGYFAPVIVYARGLSEEDIFKIFKAGGQYYPRAGASVEEQFADLVQIVQRTIECGVITGSSYARGRDFWLIVNRNSDAMIVIDPNGFIQYANPAAESLFDVPVTGLIGEQMGFPVILKEPVEIQVLKAYKTPVTVEMRMVDLEWEETPSYLISLRDITERLQAEEALRESEERFRVLADTTSAVLYVYQGDKFVNVNRTAEKVTGYTKEELLKLNFWDIFHPDFRELVRSRGRARQRGEEVPPHYEVKFLTKAGQERWAELDAGRIVYRGQAAGVVTFFDITDRKRAEEERLRLARNIELLLEATDEGIFQLDAAGKCVLVNRSASSMLGYGQEELLGKPLHSLIHHTLPDGSPCLPEKCGTLRALITGVGQRLSDQVFWSKDGTPFPVEYASNPIRDRNGKISGVVVTFTDITLRKLAEEERSYLSTYPVLNPNPIIETTFQGLVTYMNPAANRLFPDLREKRLLHPLLEGLEDTIAAFQSGKGSSTRREVKVDGRYYTESIVKLAAKDLLRLYAMDITDRKRIEDELEAARAQAEMYVDLLSHDIRNYNMTAAGFLELALGTLELGEDGKKMLHKPLESIQTSSKLIDSIVKLQLIKGEKGLQRKPINLCEVISAVKANCSNVPDRQITLDFQPVPDCQINANELVYEIFSNLVGNAIKHGDPGKPVKIKIGLEHVTLEGKEWLKASVEDHGPGIPDDHKARLFRKYERGKTRASGRGLGLYLVSTLAESYGGKIWVEDRVPGDYTRGARFVVMLPAARGENVVSKAQAA